MEPFELLCRWPDEIRTIFPVVEIDEPKAISCIINHLPCQATAARHIVWARIAIGKTNR